MAGSSFLVTGGTGCVGSWVVRRLVRQGARVTVVTATGRIDRLRLVLDDEELRRVGRVEADINDLVTLEAAAREASVTHLVHLAALQFPFCAADPVAGARVNVQGTASMFELARRLGIGRLVYASSAAVYGPRAHYAGDVVGSDAPLYPTSHYGVYKVANEQGARVAWETQGVSSVGIRPHSVYGPGRDQGVTSKPTVAMIAAAAGRPYHIDFGGRYQFQFADDVAAAFVAAAESDLEGASVFSLPGPAVAVEDIVAEIERTVPESSGRITFGDRILPFPGAFDGTPFEQAVGGAPLTPLADGVRATIDRYRGAIAAGLVNEGALDRILAS